MKSQEQDRLSLRNPRKGRQERQHRDDETTRPSAKLATEKKQPRALTTASNSEGKARASPVGLTSCPLTAAADGDVTVAAATAAVAASTLSLVEPDDDRALSFITRERNSSRSLKPEGTR